jgi:hypothetical protein
MKPAVSAFTAILTSTLVCSLAQAQASNAPPPLPPGPQGHPPQTAAPRPPAQAGQPRYQFYPKAPDAMNPGFYAIHPCGYPFGPNYCLRPPFPPFNGVLPIPQVYVPACYARQAAMQPILGFPTHPFARSPRDYFMYGQTMNDF